MKHSWNRFYNSNCALITKSASSTKLWYYSNIVSLVLFSCHLMASATEATNTAEDADGNCSDDDDHEENYPGFDVANPSPKKSINAYNLVTFQERNFV